MDTDESEEHKRMNKNPGAKQFWRLAGPILIYWGIEFVVKFIASVIIMAPYLGEMMSASLSAGSNATQEEMMELASQYTEKVLEVVLSYQVEILTVAAFCTIPLTIFLFHADRKKERMLNLSVNKKAGPEKYAIIAGLGIAGCIGANCLTIMSNLAFSSEAYQQTSEVLYSAGIAVQFISLGIIIPVAEELMFRGVLFKRYREYNKFLGAALYSTFLFALIHGNIVQFLYTFGLGMFLAYVYEKYGSIKAPILLHIVVNMVSLILTNAGALTWLMQSAMRLGIATILSAFAGSVMFVLIQKIDEKPETAEPPKEDKITPDMFR